MLRAAGYATIVDPDAPLLERDTASCGHCQQVIFVKPGTGCTTYVISVRPGEWHEEPGAFCRVCMRPICLVCHAHGRCSPWEKQLEQSEARDRLRRAVGV